LQTRHCSRGSPPLFDWVNTIFICPIILHLRPKHRNSTTHSDALVEREQTLAVLQNTADLVNGALERFRPEYERLVYVVASSRHVQGQLRDDENSQFNQIMKNEVIGLKTNLDVVVDILVESVASLAEVRLPTSTHYPSSPFIYDVNLNSVGKQPGVPLSTCTAAELVPKPSSNSPS